MLLASGTTTTDGGAVRLQTLFNGMKRRQCFCFSSGTHCACDLGVRFHCRRKHDAQLSRGRTPAGTTARVDSVYETRGLHLQPPTPAHFSMVPEFCLPASRIRCKSAPRAARRNKLDAVLQSFSPMFTERLGKTDILRHRIETGDMPPWTLEV